MGDASASSTRLQERLWSVEPRLTRFSHALRHPHLEGAQRSGPRPGRTSDAYEAYVNKKSHFAFEVAFFVDLEAGAQYRSTLA